MFNKTKVVTIALCNIVTVLARKKNALFEGGNMFQECSVVLRSSLFSKFEIVVDICNAVMETHLS
jgi:hypothetical protein